MDISPGDAVLVNVAAFTGSPVPRPESIPCRAVAVGDAQIEIQTQPPYRVFKLVVARSWVGRVDSPTAGDTPGSKSIGRPHWNGSFELLN